MNFNDERKDLEQLMYEEELPEKLATSLLCTRKGGFEIIKKQTVYCSRPYECLYKEQDNRCMNLDKKYVR